jgi:hypothetical protein
MLRAATVWMFDLRPEVDRCRGQPLTVVIPGIVAVFDVELNAPA